MSDLIKLDDLKDTDIFRYFKFWYDQIMEINERSLLGLKIKPEKTEVLENGDVKFSFNVENPNKEEPVKHSAIIKKNGLISIDNIGIKSNLCVFAWNAIFMYKKLRGEV